MTVSPAPIEHANQWVGKVSSQEAYDLFGGNEGCIDPMNFGSAALSWAVAAVEPRQIVDLQWVMDHSRPDVTALRYFETMMSMPTIGCPYVDPNLRALYFWVLAVTTADLYHHCLQVRKIHPNKPS